MNYGDRSMMRNELIRIIRLSYLLEFIVTQTLGRCYMNNIDQMFEYIENPLLNELEYDTILKPIQLEDQTKPVT